MNKMLVLAIASALALAGPQALAAEPSAAQKAQQQKMTDCNAKAGDKKGDERKAFMSACLSAKPPAEKMTQQDKMKVCNTRAGDKKGDERKAFMSSCLKAAPAPA